MNNPDRDLLQSIIDGNIDGMDDPAFANQLIEMHDRVKDDADMRALFNQAVQVYSDYAVILMEDAIAKSGVCINADAVDINKDHKEVFHGDAGGAHVIEAAIRWGDWVK